MKSILLASASVLVLAGAAAAEVEFSGAAELGYNDDSYGDNDGFYWDLEIDITLSQTLDNGLTAGATISLDELAQDDHGDNETIDYANFELFLMSDTASLYFGDTEFAAITHWTAAGDMEQDSFSEVDGEIVLRGDIMLGGIEASVSYLIGDTDDDTYDEPEQLSIGAVGTFGNFTVGMAYQEETTVGGTGGDFNPDEIFGVFGSTSFGGADVTLAYVQNSTDDEQSTGIKVAYPFGPVTATFYYVDESNGDANMGLNVAYEDGPISVALDLQDDQGVSKWGLEGSYDLGNGIVIYAGILNEDETDEDFYIGGEMDLGGGASLLVSYAEDDSEDQEDEIGAQEYQAGTTVEVSFEF